MKLKLLEWLACPACGDGTFELAIERSREERVWAGHVEPTEEPAPASGLRTVVEEGTLTCRDCGARFPVTGGIPRLLPPDGTPGPGTGHHLTDFEVAAPEQEENFRDLLEPINETAFMGRLVLDAGCGFGRHAYFAARYGAEVIGLDSSPEAVEAAARNLRETARVHIVQGDIHRPPFKKSLFDLIYSFGVLHHVADPPAAFRALDQILRPTGRLSVWVYGPRQGVTRIAMGALRGASASMKPAELLALSKLIAGALRIFSHTPHRILGQLPILSTVVTHLPVHDHSRWPFDIVVADVYDRLRIPVTAYFTGEELERWYADAGYADIQVTRRVRNTESFRGTGVRR